MAMVWLLGVCDEIVRRAPDLPRLFEHHQRMMADLVSVFGARGDTKDINTFKTIPLEELQKMFDEYKESSSSFAPLAPLSPSSVPDARSNKPFWQCTLPDDDKASSRPTTEPDHDNCDGKFKEPLIIGQQKPPGFALSMNQEIERVLGWSAREMQGRMQSGNGFSNHSPLGGHPNDT
jgi:hypothetical protein